MAGLDRLQRLRQVKRGEKESQLVRVCETKVYILDPEAPRVDQENGQPEAGRWAPTGEHERPEPASEQLGIEQAFLNRSRRGAPHALRQARCDQVGLAFLRDDGLATKCLGGAAR